MAETDRRFQRLLLLVPYVLKQPAASVDQVCERFEITRNELISDLNVLFMCGLPGYGPGDLIEAYLDGDQVCIRMAEYFSRPLSLTPAEGLLLYSGAKALEAAGERSPVLEGAIQRLGEALGAQSLERINVALDTPVELAQVRKGLEERRRLKLVYQSQSKDEVTEREVDPWSLFFSSGRWYLIGWCHRVTDERIFRVDRIRSIELTTANVQVPDDVDLTKYQSLYVESPDALPVTLDIGPEAAWVLEYYPLLSQTPLKDGWVRIKLTAGGTAWLERLLLRLGLHARVVEPAWLDQRVKSTACRLAERYKS